MLITQIIRQKQQKHLLIVKLQKLFVVRNSGKFGAPWARSCKGWWIFRLQKRLFKVCFECCSLHQAVWRHFMSLVTALDLAAV